MADDFLSTYAPLANDIAQRTNIDPSVVLGIIDTETGHGQHVSGNNIFGISPSGPRGQYVAGYPDVQTAANAFISLMQTPRYAPVTAASDPALQAAALVKSGYNTANPNYASIVANKALSIGKQLGYQGDGQGSDGATIAVSSSQPAPDYSGQPPAPKPPASAPDYNTSPPAPAQPPAGSAKDRVLADPALSTGSGGTATQPPAQGTQPQTAKDRVLADPALQTTETSAVTKALPGPSVPSPDEQSAETGLPLPRSPPPGGLGVDIANALQPAPNTTYGDVLPLARDQTTGELRFAMPNMLRAPLLGLTTQGPQISDGGLTVPGATWNPQTGTFGVTPEAQSVVPFVAGLGGRDVQFSGANPLQFVPPGTLQRAPIPAETAANLLTPEARARATEITAGAQVPTITVRPSPSTSEAPAPSSPTGVPVTEPRPRPAEPVAVAPVTENTPWVSSTTADIQRVLQENAEAGGPTSLGAAATPEQLATMTPAQVKANRRVAELNQIVTPIEGEDSTEWVRGSTPTEAERMGTPTTSQKEVMTRQRNPDAFEGPNGQLTINDRARVNAFDETLLSDTQAADLKERQQAAAAEAQGRILSTAGPVDLQGAASWINAKLADPLVQEDKYVYNSLKGLRDQLYDADGNLKTDPRAAWGMHNNLRNKLLDAKDPLSANPSEKYAVNQVNEFKGLVDSALDKASNGQFRTHLDQQAEFLKSLNAWRLLNDFRYGPNKMINAKSGMINGNAFHRFVTDLAIRRGRPGIDAAMDIPDNVMQRLINIDQDLKRAGRIDLGKPRGSPTNLFFELAGALGISGAHALTAAMTAGTPFGGIANIGVQTGISAMQRRLGQRRINRLTEQALQPPPGGLTPPPGNPLQPSP